MNIRTPILPFAAILLLVPSGAIAQDTPPDRIQELIQRLGSKYFDDRDDAKKELAAIGAPAEGALIEAIDAADFRVRTAAIELLGKQKSAKAIPRLVEAMVDEDGDIARVAAEAIQAVGAEARAAVQARRGADADYARRTTDFVAEWIEYDVEAALDPLLTPAGGWGFYEGQYRTVVALGPEAIPVLLEMFTDPTYEFHTIPDEREGRQLTLRIVAGEALAECAEGPFVQRIKDGLDGKSPEIAELWDQSRLMFEEAAAYALWTHGETSYLEGLEKRWREEVADGSSSSYSRHKLAFVVIRQQRYEEAVGIYKTTIAENPSDSGAIFNLATVYGKMGKKELALSTLKEAVEAGYDNVEWLKREGYFECIRGTPEFQAIQRGLEDRAQDAGEPQ